jgi:hypothetical protein
MGLEGTSTPTGARGLVGPINLDRNFPTEPHRNRAEPILNPTLSEVPFSSTVVKSLLPLQVTDIRDQFR